MKKFIIVMLAAFILLPATIVYADVILEPTDEFYLFNADKCKAPSQENFYANGANGSMSVKKEPGSSEETASVKNKTAVYVHCTYDLGGTVWGLVKLEKDKNPWESSGWARMDELVPVGSSNPSTGGYHDTSARDGGPLSLALIIIPVLAVVGGAVILIRVFWKPNKGS